MYSMHVVHLREVQQGSHQVCGLYDETVAHTQRGIWRAHIRLLPVIDIDSWEGCLHRGVSVLERVQQLCVDNARHIGTINHRLQSCTSCVSTKATLTKILANDRYTGLICHCLHSCKCCVSLNVIFSTRTSPPTFLCCGQKDCMRESKEGACEPWEVKRRPHLRGCVSCIIGATAAVAPPQGRPSLCALGVWRGQVGGKCHCIPGGIRACTRTQKVCYQLFPCSAAVKGC